MKQAMHIFKKDVERLRYFVALTLLAAVAFCFRTATSETGPGPTVVVLVVSWWFSIAAVIHLEPLPGTDSFWLIRPYNRFSLFLAKSLFIIALINVPVAIADVIILHTTGFPVLGNISGLIWTQVLLICVLEIPVAAVAAVTSGILGFLTATLFLVLITLGSYLLTSRLSISFTWEHFQWVRDYAAFSVLFVFAACILLGQYAYRATLLSRLAAFIGLFLAFTCAAAFPWTSAFTLQSWLHRSRVLLPTVRVDVDGERQWAGRVYRGDGSGLTADLPVVINGITGNTEVKVYGAQMTIYAPNGQTLPIEQPPSEAFEVDSGMLLLRIPMPEDWFQVYRGEAVRVKGLLYFALCNKTQSATVDPSGRRAVVPGIGLCRANPKSLVCSSAFHPSSSYVQATLTEHSTLGLVHSSTLWSDSGDPAPFPAAFNIDPLFRWSSATLTPITDVVLKRTEPVAYMVKDFEFGNLVLGHYTFRN